MISALVGWLVGSSADYAKTTKEIGMKLDGRMGHGPRKDHLARNKGRDVFLRSSTLQGNNALMKNIGHIQGTDI